MKNKILFAIMSLFMGLSMMSCSDDFGSSPATGDILNEVTTGDAFVSATTADVTGVVKDLQHSSASSYNVGVIYGTSENPTVDGTKVAGTFYNDTVRTTITGLTTGKKYYYATYVTLQGKVTKYGEVKSFTASASTVANDEVKELTANHATLWATVSNANVSADAKEEGFMVSTNEEALKNGVYTVFKSQIITTSFYSSIDGLIPSQTYYYRAYVVLQDDTKLVSDNIDSFTTSDAVMEYVDLGLSVMWGKCNVGATKESEVGALMGYSDQTGGMQHGLDAILYKAENIAGTEADNLYNMKLDADASFKSVMPTDAQMYELMSKTVQTEEEVDGVKGVRFTATNGNSIFLPYTGYREGDAVVAGTTGLYWTGEISSINNAYAASMTIDNGIAQRGVSARQLGIAVRPVQKTMFKGLQAGLSVSDPNWWPSVWASKGQGTNVDVTDYGTYTVSADCGGAINGVNVFLIDIFDGAATYAGNAVATIDKIVIDGKEVACDNSKILYGDIEGNGNFRIEIYNEFGAGTAADSPIDITQMQGQKVSVTFTLSRKAAEASLSCSDPNWSPSVWAGAGNAGNAMVEGFGTYTVKADCGGAINGVNVFCVDVLHYKDVFGEEVLNNTAACINKITIDGKEVACDNAKIIYGDIENNGNFRIEIYNDYGAGTAANSPIDKTQMQGQNVEVTFTLGSKTCEASLSCSDPNWWPSVWAGAGNAGNATVTGAGTYTVTADCGGAINGTNVFCVDILGGFPAFGALTATIDKITIDGKEIACDNSKIVVGDLEGNGNVRIEIYNDYGKTSGNSPIDKAAMQGQNVEVTFTLK